MAPIELICGPMFSGKTTALIHRLIQAQHAGLTVAAFKPAQDTRYAADKLAAHDGATLDAISLDEIDLNLDAVQRAHIVGIDEIHFFSDRLFDACAALPARGVRLILAGVDLDHRGRPFELVERFARIADHVTRLAARCARCGAAARFTQRLVAGTARIIVGGVGDYEPRCDRCFEPRA